eukprot:gene12250-13512_t
MEMDKIWRVTKLQQVILVFGAIAAVQCVTISYSDPSRCSSNQYFQFSSLLCQNCEPNMNKSSDGLSCMCKAGYYFVQNDGGDKNVKCNPCGANEVTSTDKWSCVKCQADTTFDATTRTCKKRCNTTTAISDKQQNGESYFDKRRRCIKCLNDTQPDLTQTSCKRCDNNVLTITSSLNTGISCQCPETTQVTSRGGVCMRKTILDSFNIPDSSAAANAYTVKFPQQSIISAFFVNNLQAAKVLCCVNRNFTACQLLANLCVLTDYNKDNFESSLTLNTDACSEYLKIVKCRSTTCSCGSFAHGLGDWPYFMPWLYYTTETADKTLTKTDISVQYEKGQTLRFVVAIFTPNGSFVGIENDTTVMQLCQDKHTKMSAALSFLTAYQISCSLSMTKLKSKEMFFYDLYYYVNDKLYPVPILVENFQSNGGTVNTNSAKSGWQLTRRFYIVDNLSSKTQMTQDATLIRYAQSIQLVFEMRNSNGQIYPPYMKIKYGTAAATVTSVSASFSTSYSMDANQVVQNVKISLGVLSALAIVFAILRTTSWRRRNNRVYIDPGSLGQFLVFSFNALAVVFFAVLAGACIQWLVFFKQQTVVYQVLPSSAQQSLLRTILICGFCFKVIDILQLLYIQTTIDVFFIDWERPRGRIIEPGQAGGGGGNEAGTPVSIIRTLFVANEWHEIQTLKRIKCTVQLIVVLFFLKVAGFEHLTTTDPISRFSVNTSNDYVGSASFVLRFAVTSILFLGVAVGQWTFATLIQERFLCDAIEDFVDFCSISNISILLMPQSNFGYYIHGRSVHGRADTNLKELYENFKREEDNLCDRRGLESGQECQTFEVSLTERFRTQYQKIFEAINTTGQQRQMARNNMQQMGRTPQGTITSICAPFI